MTAPIDLILPRLERVRETGPGRWLALCPSHDDKTPSLSVRENSDGMVLVYCFAGCEVLDVVLALNLNLADLFPRSLGHHLLRSTCSKIPAADCLAVIDHEALTVTVIASELRQHGEIDEPTWERLAEAVRRIGIARDRASPLKVPHD